MVSKRVVALLLCSVVVVAVVGEVFEFVPFKEAAALELAEAAAYAARATDEITLFEAGAPGEAWPLGPESWETSSSGRRVTNVTMPTLTPFLLKKQAPGVIIAPGGGYTSLAIDKEGFDIARRFNALGWHAFVLKYRVPARPDVDGLPKWWAPLQDAQRAMKTVRSRSEEWGVESVGFGGFSAGGHLTAHISTAFDSKLYDSRDDADKLSARPDFSVLVYPWALIGEGQALAPEIDVTEATPPAFLLHASDDATAHCENSLVYYESLHRRRIGKIRVLVTTTSRLELDPVGGHGFGMCQYDGPKPPNDEVCDWPTRVLTWYRDFTSPPKERLHSAFTSQQLDFTTSSSSVVA